MEKKTKIQVRNLDLYYGENHALKDVSMDIKEKCVTAFIGPSGCGMVSAHSSCIAGINSSTVATL